jgi:hypothetical protein
MLPALRAQARVQQSRNPQPSAGIIDSQSVKGADTVGRDSRGVRRRQEDQRQRFIVADTLGLLIVVVVLAASVQDRDGGKTTLLSAYVISQIRFVFADGGFAGKLVDWARTILGTVVHVVRKPEGQHGFAVIPRRRCVERTLCLAHRPMPPHPRLRTRPRHLRSHDPLGRDQHHDQPHRPRRTRHTATTLALARRIMTASHTRAKRKAQSAGDPIDKKFFYIKTTFRHERRRLPRPDRAG